MFGLAVCQGGGVTRRTQAERSDETSSKLVAAARRLFGEDGYTATSIETVAAAAGLTKGAAYHPFRSNAALFREVFVHEQEQVSAVLRRAAAEEPDSWSALLRGCRTFLEHCTNPAFRQIVLLDGPAVLGWDAVREIEYAHTLRVLSDGIRAAAADGRLIDGDLTARSQLIFGALCQAGMLLARSEDQAATFATVAAEAELLIGSLARTPEVSG
jgi:AcrR family transcriptional regulator